MTKVRESVHFLNLLYDHKDYANFDNAFSIIMKNFPEPIRLQTNTLLETVTNLKFLIGRGTS